MLQGNVDSTPHISLLHYSLTNCIIIHIVNLKKVLRLSLFLTKPLCHSIVFGVTLVKKIVHFMATLCSIFNGIITWPSTLWLFRTNHCYLRFHNEWVATPCYHHNNPINFNVRTNGTVVRVNFATWGSIFIYILLTTNYCELVQVYNTYDLTATLSIIFWRFKIIPFINGFACIYKNSIFLLKT